ncbi:hypothetical protein LINPERHAP1_LOCUS30887, partial [Linum perenne]
QIYASHLLLTSSKPYSPPPKSSASQPPLFPPHFTVTTTYDTITTNPPPQKDDTTASWATNPTARRLVTPPASRAVGDSLHRARYNPESSVTSLHSSGSATTVDLGGSGAVVFGISASAKLWEDMMDWFAYTIYILNNGYLTHAMASWPGLSLHLTTVDFKSTMITICTIFNCSVANGCYSHTFVNWNSNRNLVGILSWYCFNNGKRFNFNLLTDMFIMGQIMDRHGGPKIKSLKLTRSLTSFTAMGCNHLEPHGHLMPPP